MASLKEKRIMTAQKVYGECLLMLLIPMGLSIKLYGMAALRVLLVSVGTSFLCDFAIGLLVNNEYYSSDFSGICSGIMIALMMPSDIKLYIPALAALFAIVIVKIPFGGSVSSPFVPAAAGFAFVAFCFRDSVFAYGTVDGVSSAQSLASMLMSGKSIHLNRVNVLDILCGNICGPMGTGCVLVMLACAVFLLVRRRNALISSASFVITVAVITVIFPRTNAGIINNVFLELTSGSLLFAAVFLLTDFSTLPSGNVNKAVYGIFCGIILMTMRHMGIYEEPVCFAVILANAASPLLEQITDRFFIIASSKKKGAEEI